MDFLFPGVGLIDRIFHTVFAGGYYAVGLDTIGDAHFILRDRGKQFIAAGGGYDDSGVGEWLSLAALQYLDNVEGQTVRLGALLDNVQVKEVAEALTGQDIRIEFVNGALHFRPIGWFVDAKRIIARHFAVDGDESDLDKKWQIMGLSGSYLENRLWEDFAATASISTVIGLQFANQAGIPILTIDQGNVGTLLPTLNVFPYIRQAVLDAVNAGRVVTIPRDTLLFHRWVGSVWIDDLPGGLSTGYLISGSVLGGNTADEPFKGEEPDCGLLHQQLGADKYKAVASTEGKGRTWRQFNQDGQPLQAGNDFGIMQVNKSWDGKAIDFLDSSGNFGRDGQPDTIGFEKVQKKWDYNVEVGKAIFDDAANRAQRYFGGQGVTPAAEQVAQESAFQYNHSPGFWKYKLVNGKKVRDRFVEFHYYEKDPTTGQLVKKDYAKDSDFTDAQRKGATDSQKYAERYRFNLDNTVWDNPQFPAPC